MKNAVLSATLFISISLASTLYPFVSKAQMKAEMTTDTFQLLEVSVFDQRYEDISSVVLYEFDSVALTKSNYNDLGEFLNGNSGIYVKDYGPGSTSSMRYRGTSANHTRIFWDGISVDNVMLGQTDISLIDAGSYNGIRFLKGSQSMSLGSGGFGGILNLNEKVSEGEKFKADASVSYGSFETRKSQLNFSINDGNWTFFTHLSGIESENNFRYLNYLEGDRYETRENAAFRRITIRPTLLYAKKNHRFSGTYWYTESNRLVPSAISVPHGNAEQYDRWNRGKLTWSYQKNEFSVGIKSVYGMDDLNYYRQSTEIESESRVEYWKSYFNSNYKIISNLKGETQIRWEDLRGISVNYEGNQRMTILSAYQSIKWMNSRFAISIDGRAEHYNTQDFYLLPAFNASYSLLSDQSLLVLMSGSQNIRYPTFNEKFWIGQGNPEIQPEKSDNIEWGLVYKILESSKTELRISGSFFMSNIDEMIIWIPDESGFWSPQNINEVQNRGVEAETAFQKQLKNTVLSLKLNYTYTDSRVVNFSNIEEFNSNQQIYIPYHKGFADVSVEYNNYFVNYNLTYTGEVYTNADNSTYIPHSFPSNISFGKHFDYMSSRFSLICSVNNLFDESYQFVEHMPMPMRNYLLTLKWNFK